LDLQTEEHQRNTPRNTQVALLVIHLWTYCELFIRGWHTFCRSYKSAALGPVYNTDVHKEIGYWVLDLTPNIMIQKFFQ